MKHFDLFLSNGYLNIRGMLETRIPYIYVVAGRGTGKTYGALKYAKEEEIRYMYLRRMQTQTDTIMIPEFNPYKKLNADMGWNVQPKIIKKTTYGFYDMEYIDETLVPAGPALGYATALTTVANLRGFDASDIDLLIYDEFIPEHHERPIKNEASALSNAYDTINRNRDLPPPMGNNAPPLQQICFANANDLANPIFLEHNLVRKAEQMRKNEQQVYINEAEAYMLIILKDSPISEARKQTASYKHNKNTEYADMAFENCFLHNERSSRIKSMPIKEYRPIVTIGEITIYSHKSNGTYYISAHCTGSPPAYGAGDTERARFRRSYSWLWAQYMENNIVFEEYVCEILLNKYFS